MSAPVRECQPDIVAQLRLIADDPMWANGDEYKHIISVAADSVEGMVQVCDSYAAENQRFHDRIEELTKALEPFAKYELRMVAFAGSVKPADWKDFVWAAGLTGAQPEFRHFDNARRTLALSLEQSGSGK